METKDSGEEGRKVFMQGIRAQGGDDEKHDKKKEEKGVRKNMHNAAKHTTRRKYGEKLGINEL